MLLILLLADVFRVRSRARQRVGTFGFIHPIHIQGFSIGQIATTSSCKIQNAELVRHRLFPRSMPRTDRQHSDCLSRIELRSVIPVGATSVRFSYRFDTPECGALMYRSPQDAYPVVMEEQNGLITLDAIHQQSVFIQLLDGSSALHFSVSSYKVAR